MEIEYGHCHCGCGQKTTIAITNCKKENRTKGEPCRFLPGHNLLVNKKYRENHPQWKGGRLKESHGYIIIRMPNHPRSNQRGYVKEHILFAEKALGKPLPVGAQIHHFGDKSDNSKIVICENQEYHYLLHIREKALYECGNLNYRKCRFCKQYDDIKNMFVRKREKWSGWNIYHYECKRKYEKEYRDTKRLSD